MSPSTNPARTLRSAHPPSTLERSLRRARRVWWGVAVRRSFVVAAALAVVRRADRLARGLPLRRGGHDARRPRCADLAPLMAATFLVGLAAALAFAAWRAPSLLEVARRADRVLDQAQRLSTSFEVRTRGGPIDARRTRVDRRRRTTCRDARLGCRRSVALGSTGPHARRGGDGGLRWSRRWCRSPSAPWRFPPGRTADLIPPDRAARDAATVQRFAALLDAVSEQEDDAVPARRRGFVRRPGRAAWRPARSTPPRPAGCSKSWSVTWRSRRATSVARSPRRSKRP